MPESGRIWDEKDGGGWEGLEGLAQITWKCAVITPVTTPTGGLPSVGIWYLTQLGSTLFRHPAQHPNILLMKTVISLKDFPQDTGSQLSSFHKVSLRTRTSPTPGPSQFVPSLSCTALGLPPFRMRDPIGQVPRPLAGTRAACLFPPTSLLHPSSSHTPTDFTSTLASVSLPHL